MTSKSLVFVYGTLKKGFHNHSLLRRSLYLGEYTTLSQHKMISLGGFPGVIHRGGVTHIKGEVYDVICEDDRIALDNLEGVPHFYRKERVITNFGPAWMYVLSDEFLNSGDFRNYEPIESGEWKNGTKAA